MRIIATYANRHYEPELIELVCAWDEFCVEENYEGWEADKKKQLNSWGDDLLRHVDVEIDVDMTAVYVHLLPELKITAAAVRIADTEDQS